MQYLLVAFVLAGELLIEYFVLKVLFRWREHHAVLRVINWPGNRWLNFPVRSIVFHEIVEFLVVGVDDLLEQGQVDQVPETHDVFTLALELL